MKKNIAIITGGDSSELVISLKSAGQVRQHINPEKYVSWIVLIREGDWHVELDDAEKGQIPVNREDFSFMLGDRETRFDFAFIAMHGPPGENGKLQEYFDRLAIPYSSSGAESLALTFNKFACKNFLKDKGILTADAVLLVKGEKFSTPDLLAKVGLPCFIKPNGGGSSFGVSRVNRAEEMEFAILKALEEDDQVLVESFIQGPELSCGVLKTSAAEFIFPVTEIISRNEFFDYEAKYTEGMADEITPARISGELADHCKKISSDIYDLLECRGIVRIDFILQDDRLFFLELNGIPGMSAESIVPKQIRTFGHTENEIYNLIIEDIADW